MNNLNNFVSFWYDCVRSEGALDQSFGLTQNFQLTARTKAMFYEGSHDPFIFANVNTPINIDGEKTKAIASRVNLRGEQLYFGYPLLTFRENKTNKLRVTPLFIIQLDVENQQLTTAEPYATLGSCAFEKLGLKNEEISALNKEISEILQDRRSTTLEDIVAIIDRETALNLSEILNPDSLSKNEKLSSIEHNSVYNKAIIFTAESSTFNLHLLNDLEKLKSRRDLNSTALSYLTESSSSDIDNSFTPIMPFQYDAYQLKAIQSILGSKNSVITGPPGTGKSQFIANLIINLFMRRKKVLFVSHTGEAVRVVNHRIGEHFQYLIMQTGRKEIRQTLGEQLDRMVRANKETVLNHNNPIRLLDIEHTWSRIKETSDYILESDSIVEQVKFAKNDLDYLSDRRGLLAVVERYFKKRRYAKLLEKLAGRKDYNQLYHLVKKLRDKHVEESRVLVSHRYLDKMLNNGNYGQLAAYIKSVESRKSLSRYAQPDSAESYISTALSNTNVWSCTLKSLGANFPLKPGIFDYVIFDEASQIDLPSAAPALYRAKNVVVVGDERQLTHIAKINDEVERQLAETHNIKNPQTVSYRKTSLFSSAKYKLSNTEHTLLGHYRSNFQIAQIFNSVFYDDKLRVYTPTEKILPEPLREGALWVDTKGTAAKASGGSRENMDEADKTIALVAKMIPFANKHQLTIGITSPYSRQTRLISEKLEKMFHAEQLEKVKVLTVHKFQGSEVDILFFSPVVAGKGDAGSTSWYRNNPQILNVAISRAKRCLIVVGDKSHAIHTKTKLGDIADAIDKPLRSPSNSTQPSNPFENDLANLLERYIPSDIRIAPQYLVDGRYTIDFALTSRNTDTKVAIELDGYQHHIEGDVAVFDDTQRDKYLTKNGWKVLRIPIHTLLRSPNQIIDSVLEYYI